MLVFFNLKPPCEKISYGGGLFFVENLIDYLKSKKISVTFDLENDIDVIFIIDPRKGKFREYRFLIEPIIVPSPPNTKIKFDLDIFFISFSSISLMFKDEMTSIFKSEIISRTFDNALSVLRVSEKTIEIFLILLICRFPTPHDIYKKSIQ